MMGNDDYQLPPRRKPILSCVAFTLIELLMVIGVLGVNYLRFYWDTTLAVGIESSYYPPSNYGHCWSARWLGWLRSLAGQCRRVEWSWSQKTSGLFGSIDGMIKEGLKTWASNHWWISE